MKKRNVKRLHNLVVAILFLFAFGGNYLQADNPAIGVQGDDLTRSDVSADFFDITYNLGMRDTVSQEKNQTIAKGSVVVLTDMGVRKPGCILLGWQASNALNLVSRHSAFERMLENIPTYHALGDSFTVSEDLNFYPVWAVDRNNDGMPDYTGAIILPSPDGLLIKEDDLSLRSTKASGWDNNFDQKAFYDSVYCVGCTYNQDPANKLYESLITFDPRTSFEEADQSLISSAIPMHFVIEYGGVLTDSCLIGGAYQKHLKTIEMPIGFTVDRLLSHYPLLFDAIKEDGQGVLKMYFINPVTNTHPTRANWSTIGGGVHGPHGANRLKMPKQASRIRVLSSLISTTNRCLNLKRSDKSLMNKAASIGST